MAKWTLIVEPHAKQEIRDGFDYYKEEADVQVARRFRDAVRGGMRMVVDSPERWPVFDEHGGRRYLGDLPEPQLVVSEVTIGSSNPDQVRPADWAALPAGGVDLHREEFDDGVEPFQGDTGTFTVNIERLPVTVSGISSISIVLSGDSTCS